MAPKLSQVFSRKKCKQTGDTSAPPQSPEAPQPPHEPQPPQEPQPQPEQQPRMPPPIQPQTDVDWVEIEQGQDSSSSEGDDMDVDDEPEPVPPSRPAEEELQGVDIPLHTTEARKQFEKLKEKKFENSRCIDTDMLDDLGFSADFYSLTESVGFKRAFWDIEENAYTSLTIEFLCSLPLNFDKDGNFWTITFSLLGSHYVLTEIQIAEYFGLERGSITDAIFHEDLWESISNTRSGKDPTKKNSAIQHPTIRFIQRAMSLSIFARGESGIKTSKEELAVLSQMLMPIGTERLNLAYFLMKHWEEIAKNKRPGKGQITIGGYITHLATKMGVTSFRMKKSGGPNRLDMKLLSDMKFVQQMGGHYHYVFGRHYFPLPFDKKVIISRPDTFLLVDKQGHLIQHVEEDVQRRVEQAEAATYAPQFQAGMSSSQQQPQHGTYDFNAMYNMLQEVHTAQMTMTQGMAAFNTRLDTMEQRQMEEIEAARAHRQQMDRAMALWETRFLPPQGPPNN